MKYPTKKPIRIGTEYLPVLLKVELTEQQRSDLLQAMLEYLFLGRKPEGLDPMTKCLWDFIQWDLDHEKRRKGGTANGRS